MKPLPTLILFISLSLLYSCGSDDGPGITLSTLEIASSNGTRIDLSSNETTLLTVEGFDSSGEPMPLTSEVSWSTDNANLTVDNDGLVTPVSLGSCVVTASVENVQATISIQVWDASAPRTEIYVSDVGPGRNGPHRIIRYDEDGTNPVVLITTSLDRPQDIVFLEEEGVVLVSSLGNNRIRKYDIETGSLVGTFASDLSEPTRMDIGPDGLLYVLQWGGGHVRRYELDGTFVDDFTSIDIRQAIGQAWDAEGNYYVSSWNDGSNGWVRKFDREGVDMGFFISTNLSGPTDIWFAENGNFFVNDWSANSVKQFSAGGAYLGRFIESVSTPEGVALLDNGHLLIGAGGTGSIPEFDAQGAFVSDLIPNGRGGLATPNAVVVRKVNQ